MPRNPLRTDPTRTAFERRAMEKELKRRFARLKAAIVRWLDGLVTNCGGPGSGVPGPCPTAPPNEAKPGLISRVGAKLGALADRIPVIGSIKRGAEKAMTWVKDKLASRYGEATAKAIMTGGFFGGYGVAGAAYLATGTPGIPFVNDLVAIAVGTAIAETKHQIGKLRGNVDMKEAVTEAAKLIREAMDKVIAEHGDELVKGVAKSPKDADTLTQIISEYDGEKEKLIGNAASDDLKKFKRWIAQQTQTTVGDEMLWQKYVEQGFKKGLARSFTDVVKAPVGEKLDFYNGTKDEFLRSSFNRPVSVEKVQALVTRSLNGYEGVTQQMASRMTNILADGLVGGKSRSAIAKELVSEADVSLSRANTIARTELVRAHADGQLAAMENLGVKEVGVAVEWSTAGDDRVCELCAPLEGIVLALDEAAGMLPRHPNCRCAWLPANVGEDDAGQTDTKRGIDKAFKASGLDATVSRDRPTSVLNRFSELLLNRFVDNCGGPGSGVPGPCPNISTADRPKTKDGLYIKVETLAQASGDPAMLAKLRASVPPKERAKFDAAIATIKGASGGAKSAPSPSPSSKPLAERVKVAGDVISQTVGPHNLASMADIRDKLASQGISDRKEQDEAIHQLRRSGKIAASAIEGGGGARVPQRELDAALTEKTATGTARLGYISIRR